MRSPATAAEVQRRGTRMGNAVSVVVARADEAIEQHHALAAVRLVQRRPAVTARAGLPPARLLAGEGEVLEERDVVVLPTGGARHHREARVVLAGLVATDVVLGGKPQTGAARVLGERHHRATDPAHEPVHDRAKQRVPVAACGSSEGEPGEDFSFRHRPAHVLPEHLRQLVQRARRVQLLVQAEDQLVAGEHRMQRFRPVAFAKSFPPERAPDRPHRGPGAVLVLHGLDAALEDVRGVFRRGRRDRSRHRPDLGLVVFPDRLHLVGRDTEEPRCEVLRGLRVLPVDDGGRGGDAGGADSARCGLGGSARCRSSRFGPITIDSVRQGSELLDSARFGPGEFSRRGPAPIDCIRLGPLPCDSTPHMPGSRIDIVAAERAKAPDEAGRLRAQCAGERVRLVEHQEVEPCTGEQLDVLLAGEKQLELLDVGQQDAWLPAGGAHDLAGADLLPRIDRLAAAFAPRPREPGFVVGPRRPRPQPDAHHVRLPLRGLADVDPERNARARQHPAQPHELVFGKGVHRIDDDRADAGRRLLVPEREASADDGVEEALGLAGPGAGGDKGRPTRGNRTDCAFLVAVEVGDVLRDPLAQVRVEQPFGDQRGDRRALPERPR